MLRLVSACVAICFGAGAAIADTGMLPNGAVVTWERLKICPADECGWAFFDASKNQSRNWCEWGCGNRAKTRNYRARRRATAASHKAKTG